MRYDAAVGHDPQEWLELDEGERTVIVRQYHKRARERSGNAELHAIIKATVETQIAEGHPDVKAAFERLSLKGLDRHNVVHAIGSVLAGEIYGVMKSPRPHAAGVRTQAQGAHRGEVAARRPGMIVVAAG